MGIKKESGEVRREQIVRAAINIIGAEGIQKFTTARVAREVGISEANLYRHFKNKEAILTALIDDIERTLLGNLDLIESTEITGLEKMERVFKLHIDYIQENAGIPRIVFSSEVLFIRNLQKKLLGCVNQYMKRLGKIISEGVKDGSIKKDANPEAMATMFVGLIQFNALRWLMGGFKYSLSDKGDKLWLSYKKYLEAKRKR
ncbi:MAG: TetR family transcriptional regulator [Deltaproteobacteria bacterium]|nr:TetR family transcriptional regulator [Deltaproteobacteria bacterium]